MYLLDLNLPPPEEEHEPFVGQSFLSLGEAYIFYKNYAKKNGFMVQKFGDVVVFDTTYKVNAYDMPCAFFLGIDNHEKTVLFGSALLRNETTYTFKWLMKTFVTVMNKAPKTIVTDQDPWMCEAISSEMPTTKHSFCIWHITAKFSGWFTALLKHEYQKWCADFYTLYKMSTVEEFEQNWFVVVSKYNLQNNRHVEGMYKIRHFWAPCYLHDYFFGGMTTTGRSESINAFTKRFVSSHTNLSDFVKQVELRDKKWTNTEFDDSCFEAYFFWNKITIRGTSFSNSLNFCFQNVPGKIEKSKSIYVR